MRAFMPNFIHSLDASSLALLVDLLFKTNNKPEIFTVHDCFAVTANNIENIMEILKLIYIEIYSNEQYLSKLDKFIRDSIKGYFCEEAIDENNNINPRLTKGIKK
nr:hypothetical protein [Ceratocystis fimbriata]WPM94767.1 hypothetical protein [Ceratocystis fimbriata]